MRSSLSSRKVHRTRLGWDGLTHEWSAALRYRGTWRGSRSATLAIAQGLIQGPSQRLLDLLRAKGWWTPEALVQGWAAARRWTVFEDVGADVLELRMPVKRLNHAAAKRAIPDPCPRLFED